MTTNLLAAQLSFEELLNNNELIPRVRKEFMECESFDFREHLKRHGIDVKFGIDVLVQMALHKRCNLPTLMGIMRHHFDDAQEVSDELVKCIDSGIVEWNVDLKVFIVRFTLTAQVQEDLDRYQYPLPMVVRPLLVETNRGAGYYTDKRSVILRDNHHEDDTCLDHINRLNQVTFSLNMDVVTFIRNQWRNLDKPKEGETSQEFEKRKRAFEKYDKSAKHVIKLITDVTNVFYLTHRYDKRGRTYCQGYHVNYQGTAWNKACVEFAQKELIE